MLYPKTKRERNKINWCTSWGRKFEGEQQKKWKYHARSLLSDFTFKFSPSKFTSKWDTCTIKNNFEISSQIFLPIKNSNSVSHIFQTDSFAFKILCYIHSSTPQNPTILIASSITPLINHFSIPCTISSTPIMLSPSQSPIFNETHKKLPLCH